MKWRCCKYCRVHPVFFPVHPPMFISRLLCLTSNIIKRSVIWTAAPRTLFIILTKLIKKKKKVGSWFQKSWGSFCAPSPPQLQNVAEWGQFSMRSTFLMDCYWSHVGGHQPLSTTATTSKQPDHKSSYKFKQPLAQLLAVIWNQFSYCK